MPQNNSILTDPTAVFAYLATILGLVFWLSGLPRLQRLFRVTPPVIYAYFLPTLSTTLGITPAASPAYDWMVRYLLPVALILLMVTTDLKSVLRLGGTAIFMVMTGTVGIILGAPVALQVFGRLLPSNAWTGFAALSGSWIGGTANMVAMAESVGTPDALMGPIIVVDTVVGYGWMGILLLFSAWQTQWDRRIGAHTALLEATDRRLAEVEMHSRPLELPWLAVILGVAFGGAALAVAAGDALPSLGNPTIISGTTWTVLLVVTVGLLLSFSQLRRIEDYGASRVGYAALYLLLTAIGARADLAAVVQAPAFLAAGALWIAIHALVLLLVARLVRAPLFFVATASMANIGGAASAPVVAGIYRPAMAPVGLVMAVFGYILGIYGALVASWLLSVVGG